MASIEKRKNKTKTSYRVRYWSGRRNEQGKRLYDYSEWMNKRRDAQYFLEHLSEKKKRKSNLLSIDNVLDTWLRICEKEGRDGRNTIRYGTLKNYRSITNVARDYSWNRSPEDLTKEDMRNFRGWLLRTQTRDKAMRVMSLLTSAFKECVEQGLLEHNPAAGVTIKKDKNLDTEIDIPTKLEMKAILSAAERLHTHSNPQVRKSWKKYYPIIILAYATGMRPQEYLALPDTAITHNSIKVIQAIKEEGVVEKVLKSKSSKRTIPIDPVFLEPTLWYIKNRWIDNKHRLIFPSANGTVQRRQNFYRRAWLPLMREAGLGKETEKKSGQINFKPKYVPYVLRHFFASMQIDNDKTKKRLSAKRIQRLMGHSDIMTTYNVYGHLIETDDDEVDNAIRCAMLL